jgi:hypothetical protein
MTRFASLRRTSVTGGSKPMTYCRDNFRYYCLNYRIQYAGKGVRNGNLYSTGMTRVAG